MNRLVKYLAAASKPAFWPAIARGVMPEVEHIEAIRRLNRKTLIDVGANKGQFSLVARFSFPEIEIHAFEPLEPERTLLNTILGPPARVYPWALSNASDEADFFVTSRHDSSSLLVPGSGQKASYGVELESVCRVQRRKLAEVIEASRLRKPILLKLDVQGGEIEVLKGAGTALAEIEFIYCEASFVRLYEAQPLIGQITDFLRSFGFSLSGVFNQSTTNVFGPTEADILFQKSRGEICG
jgi:FkbM family methyltransferase